MLAFFHILALDAIGITMGILVVAFVAQPYCIRARLAIKRARNTLTRWQDRVQLRFKDTGTFAFMFAWWKIRMDPMFIDLPVFLKTYPEPKVTMDLGCGFGVAGNVLLDWCPAATMYGVDPDPSRVPVAAKSFSPRGTAFQGSAPDFEVPGLPEQFHTVFCLDMIHFLTEEQLLTTFNRIRAHLEPGGHFFLRSLVPPVGKGSFLWRLGGFIRNVTDSPVNHRDAERIKELLATAGFTLLQSQPTTGNLELVWFICRT